METITVLTPTRHRPRMFDFVQACMMKSTYPGNVQWIICGETKGYSFDLDQLVIGNGFDPKSSRHDLCNNLLAALPFVISDKVILAEDDDALAPGYLTEMSRLLDDYPLVGLSPCRYYHLPTSTWVSFEMGFAAPLGCTAFRSEVMDTFRQGLEIGLAGVDQFLWTHWVKTLGGEAFIGYNDGLHTGLKDGLGIGVGHRQLPYADVDGSVLLRWLGPEALADLERCCE